MAVQEIKSRLFYIRGEGRIETAYGIEGRSSIVEAPVDNGRCLYLVRLEIAPKDHPEMTKDRFELWVQTPKDGLQWVRHSGYIGFRGEEIPFQKLVEGATIPLRKANKHQEADPRIRKAIGDIIGEQHFDFNFRLISEFDGDHDGGFQGGLSNFFDPIRTYMPIIVQAVKEVQPEL